MQSIKGAHCFFLSLPILFRWYFCEHFWQFRIPDFAFDCFTVWPFLRQIKRVVHKNTNIYKKNYQKSVIKQKNIQLCIYTFLLLGSPPFLLFVSLFDSISVFCYQRLSPFISFPLHPPPLEGIMTYTNSFVIYTSNLI